MNVTHTPANVKCVNVRKQGPEFVFRDTAMNSPSLSLSRSLSPGDPVLPGVERQPANPPLHLHTGALQHGHHGDQLQAVCAAGGGGGADLPAQQHAGGGEFRHHTRHTGSVARELLPCRQQDGSSGKKFRDDAVRKKCWSEALPLVPTSALPRVKVQKSPSFSSGLGCGSVTLFNHSCSG